MNDDCTKYMQSAWRVVEAVSEEAGVSVAQILGPRRETNLVAVRQLAMLLLTERCHQYTNRALGRLLRRDPSTIHYGKRTAAKRASEDADYRALYWAARQRLDEHQEAAE